MSLLLLGSARSLNLLSPSCPPPPRAARRPFPFSGAGGALVLRLRRPKPDPVEAMIGPRPPPADWRHLSRAAAVLQRSLAGPLGHAVQQKQLDAFYAAFAMEFGDELARITRAPRDSNKGRGPPPRIERAPADEPSKQPEGGPRSRLFTVAWPTVCKIFSGELPLRLRQPWRRWRSYRMIAQRCL